MGIVLDAIHPAHRQPGKQFTAHVRDAGESALEDQSTERLPHRQLGGNPAPKRLAERYDVAGGESLLPQPAVGGLRVQIRSFFTGPAFAPAIAAIVECEN